MSFLQNHSIELLNETQGSSSTISSFQMGVLKQLVNNKLHISEMSASKTSSVLGSALAMTVHGLSFILSDLLDMTATCARFMCVFFLLFPLTTLSFDKTC